MEKAVLPVSRYRGITTLPSEIMVRIMTLVGEQFLDDPEALKNAMWTFMDEPPFSYHVIDAIALKKHWKDCDTRTVVGGLPGSMACWTIETFIFSHHGDQTLEQILGAFESLSGLRHLEISCDFDREALRVPEYHSESSVTMSHLRSLFISNWSQSSCREGAETDSLWDILQNMAMPILRTIRAVLQIGRT